MANHPNRNWRRNWTWEAPDTAVHVSGLRVRFEPHPDGGWFSEGNMVTNTQAVEGFSPERIARLMREAGDYAAEQFRQAAALRDPR